MTQLILLDGIPDEQMDKLRVFAELLSGRGVDLGAVAESDRDVVWERHVLDSLRVAPVLEPSDDSAYDLGSGAGLPGIPLAIARSDLHVGLVESQRRRVAWLEFVRDELALSNVEVVARRIEEVRTTVDVCFARALAAPERSWELARPLLRPGGRLVYFAGSSLDRDRLAAKVPVIHILEAVPLDSGGPLVIIGEQ
jgi:16S rRNA (guanine527-N7)-methyltransferase